MIQENSAEGDVDYTERLRISQGWLYRVVTAGGVAVVFVPALEGLE